jgi:hypothetical protein
MNATIERVVHAGRLLAIVIPAGFRREGIEFFTPGDFSQQLAYMNRPAGHRVPPHVHNPVRREVTNTLEVLFVRSGRVRVDLYGDDRQPAGQRTLAAGDIILLASGGHGITMLEPTEIIEVKQGPYAGEQDKARFDPPGGEA